jgi:hypothetical protein
MNIKTGDHIPYELPNSGGNYNRKIRAKINRYFDTKIPVKAVTNLPTYVHSKQESQIQTIDQDGSRNHSVIDLKNSND